jgi:hypothetical protein
MQAAEDTGRPCRVVSFPGSATRGRMAEAFTAETQRRREPQSEAGPEGEGTGASLPSPPLLLPPLRLRVSAVNALVSAVQPANAASAAAAPVFRASSVGVPAKVPCA